MAEEIEIRLSPAQQRTAAMLSCSPFDEARAGRDAYYSTTTACESHPAAPHREAAALANALQEMELRRWCDENQRSRAYPFADSDLIPSTASRTRQAASVTRAVAPNAKAQSDRLTVLRAQLKACLHRHAPLPVAVSTSAPMTTQSPSYDRDITLGKSPSAGEAVSAPTCSTPRTSPNQNQKAVDESFSPQPRPVHYLATATPSPSPVPLSTRHSSRAHSIEDQKAAGLFVNTPSPSPEVCRAVPEPYRNARLSSTPSAGGSASPAGTTTKRGTTVEETATCHTTSRSLGYSSARRSLSADEDGPLEFGEPMQKPVPISVEQQFRCGNCLVEDVVVLSHPSTVPNLHFCPFCGFRLSEECVEPG